MKEITQVDNIDEIVRELDPTQIQCQLCNKYVDLKQTVNVHVAHQKIGKSRNYRICMDCWVNQAAHGRILI